MRKIKEVLRLKWEPCSSQTRSRDESVYFVCGEIPERKDPSVYLAVSLQRPLQEIVAMLKECSR